MNTYTTIEIPEKCTHVKLDIGLSYTAPMSNRWLIKEPNVCVIGFEPNIICCNMILNQNINPEDKSRFKIYNYALSDTNKETKLDFYINGNDYGTSSLYSHNENILGKIEKIVKVDVISLKIFFDNFPWDRFEYIDYIKIDAQGSDLNILKGAKEYLKERVVYVTAEPDGHYYIGSDDCNEKNLDDYMESQDFIRIKHPDTIDPTYLNKKFQHLKDKIWIHQNGPWPY
jgi:FkbM family methyltransferase